MITVGSFVRSKKLLKPADAVGEVTGIFKDEVAIDIARMQSYDQTVYICKAINRWIEEYPGSDDLTCYVKFDQEVENREGRKSNYFIMPLADLEEATGPCVLIGNNVISISDNEYADIKAALGDDYTEEQLFDQVKLTLAKRE